MKTDLFINKDDLFTNIETTDLVDIIIAVYSDFEVTRSCLQSVIDSLEKNTAKTEVVVVDDCTKDERIALYIESLESKEKITLIKNRNNLGYVRSINRGLALHPDRDAVILNADTLVCGKWIDRLIAHSKKDPDTGTITPISNNATILSYPEFNQTNPIPDTAQLEQLNEICASLFSGESLEIPTCIGFCTFMKRQCLIETGLFDASTYEGGYAEENDFSMRSFALGWRHVAALDIFVGHHGEKSFKGQKQPLMQRNIALLTKKYPVYNGLVQNFIKKDPILYFRRALDFALMDFQEKEIEMIVTLNSSGGVKKHVDDECARLDKAWKSVLVLKPESPFQNEECQGKTIGSYRISMNKTKACFPNMVFDLPDEYNLLHDRCRALDINFIHVHHFLDHHPNILEFIQSLKLPYSVMVHDYSWICPRINLIDGTGLYCGEPDIENCENCIKNNGHDLWPGISVAELRKKSHNFFKGADSLFVPSRDTATRMMRYFPDCTFQIKPMEKQVSTKKSSSNSCFLQTQATLPRHDSPPALDIQPGSMLYSGGGEYFKDYPMRIAVIGAIGPHKGYDLLKKCALDAVQRKLPIEFVVAGYTLDDIELIKTGKVFVTGKFEEHEAVSLIERQKCRVALFLSVWPETWCYCLTQAWQAGLFAMAFDLGAFSERIQSSGRGWLMPLEFSPEVINNYIIRIGTNIKQ